MNSNYLLRPIRVSDAGGYLACHQDPGAKANFVRVPNTVAEAKKEITDNRKDHRCWAIVVDGCFAGFINLRLNKIPRYKHSAIIGYGIHKDFRGRGLATKALREITSYGFNKLGLRRIVGWCKAYNKASHRVLEKAGYEREGVLKKNKFLNGRYLNDVIYAKVR